MNVSINQELVRPSQQAAPAAGAAPLGTTSIPTGVVIALDNAERVLAVEAGSFEIYVLIGPMRHFLTEVTRPGAVMFGGGPKGRLVALAPDGGRLRELTLRELDVA